MTTNNLLSTQGDRELFLETLINQSKDGILVIDREGLVLFANPVAEDMFSDQEQDLLGYQIGMPAIQDDVELRLPQGDEIRMVEMRASHMTWEDQQVYLATLRDVTSRVKVEQELRKREELLRETGQMARVGGWEINFETNTVWWSDVTREIHEVPEGYEPTLSEAIDFYPPEVRPALQEAIRRTREEDVPFDVELPFVTAQGKELWVRAIGKGERLPGGKMRVHGTFQDITEQKMARDRLRESEQKFRTLYETMAQGVVYQNAEGEITSANPAAKRILGLALDQMQGKTSLDPDWRAVDLDGNPLPGDQHPAMVALRSGEEVENFVFGVHKPQRDEHVWISASAIPQFKPGSDAPYQVFTTFLDISERVSTEKVLEERVKELRCLSAVSTEIQRDPTLEELGQKTVEALIPAMRYPELTVPVVAIDGQRFESDGFHPGLKHKLRADIRGKHGSHGFVSVYYTEDKPFLIPEEQNLLDRIAEMLGLWHEEAQAERARQRSQRRFRALIENAQDMIAIVDQEGTIVYNSPAIQNVLGYTPEEHDGKKVFEFLHPDDLARVIEYFQKRVEEPGSEGRIEFRMRHKNGEYRVIESVGRSALDEPGVEGIVINSRDITQRKENEKKIERHVERLSIQHQIASAGVETNDQDRIIEQTTELIMEAFSPQNGGILLLNQKKGILDHHPSYNIDEEYRAFTANLGEGVIGRVAESGEPLNISDVSEIKEYPQISPDIRSELCVPIQSGQHLWGVVNIESHDVDAFSPEDKDMLVTVANQLATVLDKVHTVSESQLRMERLSALREIDRAISGSLDIKTTLNVIIDRTIKSLEVDAGAVLLYQPHLQTLEYVSKQGFRTDEIDQATLRVGEDLAGKVAFQRQTIHVPDLTLKTIKTKYGNMIRNEGFVSYYGVPLIAKGEIVGVLEVFQRSKLDPPPEWMDFLEMLAGQAAIAIDRLQLFNDLERSNIDLIRAYNEVIEGWARALELRDQETEGHSRRVERLTLNIARRMGIEGDKLAHIRQGALLHDIGKMGIPDHILHKPGKLSEEEWEVMRKHPTFAYELLSPINHLKPALEIPYCHHEKWDGSGYPRGLKGTEIPLEARIFAVVDVWDALRSDRPYRDAWSDERALEHIKDQSGEHFDPQVVDMFLDVVDQ